MSRANIPLNFLSQMRRASHLSQLLAEAGQRGAEQARLLDLLPPALRDQVLIQRDDACLSLTAPNNAVAQMLHFQGQNLLRASGCESLRIRIGKVDSGVSSSSPALVERHLSARSAQLLREAADDFEDQTLADVFRRLAENAKGPTSR